MNVFEERYYTINRFLLSLIGLWPYMDKRKMFIRSIFVQGGILCSVVIEIKLYESINHEWQKVENNEEYKILEKFAAKTRIFTILIILTLYIHVGIAIPGSIYPLLLDVINPLNETREAKFLPLLEYFSGRERYFLKILVLYYLTMIVIGITAASTFGLLIVCVQHACSMFALTGYVMRYSLKREVEQLDSRLDLDFLDEEDKTYKRMIRATKCHKRALQIMTEWYLAPIKVQKLLVMIMMRSIKPSYLSVGSMFVLSNELSLIILRYMAQIMEDWGNLKLTKEFNILLNYCTLCKKCIIIMMFSYNTYLSIMFLLSLKPVILDMMLPLNETRPHMLIIPMNWYNGQEKYFFKILILQYLALILLGFGSITGLSIYLVSLQYICAMFRIIGCLLDNILEDNEKKLKLIDDEVVYAKIIHIIHLHNKTVQFIDELNNKFNELYLALMACALVYYGISIDQILVSLTQLLDDWVNMKNTKEYDVLKEYANYARECIKLWIRATQRGRSALGKLEYLQQLRGVRSVSGLAGGVVLCCPWYKATPILQTLVQPHFILPHPKTYGLYQTL
ncbi:hypothetical protein M0802_009776 [Mischocyttarus mexicanus]|nr:hypothetical protein M0802_009776 [Mischocyttarus mexicanus]